MAQLIPLIPCSNCNSKNWERGPDISSLIRLYKKEDDVIVDTTKVFPVRPWVCLTCGYTILFKALPEEIPPE